METNLRRTLGLSRVYGLNLVSKESARTCVLVSMTLSVWQQRVALLPEESPLFLLPVFSAYSRGLLSGLWDPFRIIIES